MPIVNVMKEKELKNAYIGEVYEYSYDFRDKSTTQLTNDWWSVLWWTLETGSSWITSPTGKDVTLWHSVDLSTAKKITIDTSIVRNRDDAYSGRGMWFWVTLNSSNWCWFRVYNSWWNYRWIRTVTVIWWTEYEWTNTGNIWTSSYNPKFIIDLENKTLTWEISWYSNSTYTLSDAQITSIRSMPYLTVYATQHNFYIQNVSITVE